MKSHSKSICQSSASVSHLPATPPLSRIGVMIGPGLMVLTRIAAHDAASFRRSRQVNRAMLDVVANRR